MLMGSIQGDSLNISGYCSIAIGTTRTATKVPPSGQKSSRSLGMVLIVELSLRDDAVGRDSTEVVRPFRTAQLHSRFIAALAAEVSSKESSTHGLPTARLRAFEDSPPRRGGSVSQEKVSPTRGD